MTKNIAMDLLSYHSLGPPAATLEIQLTVELLRAVGQSLSQEAESQQAGSLVSVEAESCTPQSHSLYADTSCRTPSSLFSRQYNIPVAWLTAMFWFINEMLMRQTLLSNLPASAN